MPWPRRVADLPIPRSNFFPGATRCPDWSLRADAPPVGKIPRSAAPFRSPAMPGGRGRKLPVNVCRHRKHGATAPVAMDGHDGVPPDGQFSTAETCGRPLSRLCWASLYRHDGRTGDAGETTSRQARHDRD